MPPPIEHEADDAFWSIVLAVARLRATVEYVEHRREDRPERGLILEPYGMPRVRYADAAHVEMRLMTLDTHTIPARAAREEIGRILGYVPLPAPPPPGPSTPPMDTPTSDERAAIEAITRAEEAVVAALPSPVPLPSPPVVVLTPAPLPVAAPAGPEDGASIRYSLMELD